MGCKSTPAGIVSVPTRNGRPITTDEFAALPRASRERIEAVAQEMEKHVAAHIHRLHQLAKEAAERVAELDREVARYAVAGPFHELEERYAGHPEVLAHASAVRDEIITHMPELREERPPSRFRFSSRATALLGCASMCWSTTVAWTARR